VTIVIVGIGMLLVLQGLNSAKMTAAQTRNTKLSRDLALLTLGQVASGMFQEDIENGLSGTYAEEGYPQFSYEVIVGDLTFTTDDYGSGGNFDTWEHQRQLEADQKARDSRDEKEDPKDREEPFEKVKIKVTFLPKIRVGEQELKNELVLEQWIPWRQVYGQNEEDAAAAAAGSPPAAAGGSK
jgi:hypothetical protein